MRRTGSKSLGRLVVASVLAMFMVGAISPGIAVLTESPRATAWSGSIEIFEDGHVEPADAPITVTGSTYYLSSDIELTEYDEFIVERSDCVLDGNGHTVQGAPDSSDGIWFWGAQNIVVRNLIVRGCDGDGLIFTEKDTENITDVTIEDCLLTENSGSGVCFNAEVSDVSVLRSEFLSNGGNGLDFSYGVNGCIIEACTFSQNGFDGLRFYENAPNLRVANSTISHNGDEGLYVGDEAEDLWVMRNEIDHNAWGIDISSAVGARIVDNDIHNNSFDGIRCERATDTSILRNHVQSNGGTGILVNGESSACVIADNHVFSNDEGIYAWSLTASVVTSNVVSGNALGMSFTSLSGVAVHGNFITNNVEIGLELGYTLGGTGINNSQFLENTIQQNGFWDISIVHSFFATQEGNVIYHNTFTNSTKISNQEPDGYSWDYGYPEGGNYWSAYADVDEFSGPNQDQPGVDGIWDSPYQVCSGPIYDRYPLTKPYDPDKIRMTPTEGGNVGQVTIRVQGLREEATEVIAASLQRTNQPSIQGFDVVARYETVYATFDLTGRSPGQYSLVLTKAGSGTISGLPAFTVVEGGGAQFYVGFTGRDQIRMGGNGSTFMTIFNDGNVDSNLTLIHLTVDAPVEFTDIETTILPPPIPQGGTEVSLPTEGELIVDIQKMSEVTLEIGQRNNPHIEDFFIGNIPAGGSLTFKLKTHCQASPNDPGIAIIPMVGIPIIKQYVENYLENFNDVITERYSQNPYKDYTASDFGDMAWDALDRTSQEYTPWEKPGKFVKNMGELVCDIFKGKFNWAQLGNDLFEAVEKVELGWNLAKWITALTPVKSMDPNEKVGTSGFGQQGFVPSIETCAYTVFFENLANATASAETIRVVDQLDTDLDWGTLMIGPTSHSQNGTVSFDQATGVITWLFQGIYLPPNVSPPEGEGWVMFYIKPKAGLPSGTVISNKATIYFDYNAPIETNLVANTLDLDLPTSSIAPLSDQEQGDFTVSWSGSDGQGAGIMGYDIYVSEDDGQYQLWLSQTPNQSAVFSGKQGHAYSFYSVAVDNVGNREVAPSTHDARLQVKDGSGWIWMLLIVVAVILVAVLIGLLLFRSRRRRG